MPAIKFRGVDFIAFDSLLSDDERLVRDTARKFIEDNLIPIIEECNRAGRFPRELVKPMADLGFFGASLQGYGCAGMSNVEYGLVTQELERGDSGVRSFVSVQSALVMYPIFAFGSDEQKNTWLPAMQKGEKLGCFGLTEPDFGSNPGGMRTRAKKVGKEYVLNGEKMWITSGSIADVAVIWAKGSRLPRRDRPPRLQSRRHSWQVVAARVGHVWTLASRRSYSRIQFAAEERWPEISADVPEPGTLWNRLGRDRRGHVVLRLRVAILIAAQAIPRSAHRLAPTRAGKTRLDDQRDHQSATACPTSRPSERRRQSRAPAHLNGQTKQCLDGAGVRAHVTRHPRRERRRRRLSHHAPPDEPRVSQDLRGHA